MTTETTTATWTKTAPKTWQHTTGATATYNPNTHGWVASTNGHTYTTLRVAKYVIETGADL